VKVRTAPEAHHLATLIIASSFRQASRRWEGTIVAAIFAIIAFGDQTQQGFTSLNPTAPEDWGYGGVSTAADTSEPTAAPS
jgi:hypothetical protein